MRGLKGQLWVLCPFGLGCWLEGQLSLWVGLLVWWGAFLLQVAEGAERAYTIRCRVESDSRHSSTLSAAGVEALVHCPGSLQRRQALQTSGRH